LWHYTIISIDIRKLGELGVIWITHPSLVATTFPGALLDNVATSPLNVVIVAAADAASFSTFTFFDRFGPAVVERFVARPF